MPIYQDLDRRFAPRQLKVGTADAQTEAPSSESFSGIPDETNDAGGPSMFQSSENESISDREELMQRIKKGEHPTWSPSGNLEIGGGEDGAMDLRPDIRLPKAERTLPNFKSELNASEMELSSPHEIQRPRSALHSGDFRESSSHPSFGFQPLQSQGIHSVQQGQSFSPSPTASWSVSAVTPYSRRTGEPAYDDYFPQSSTTRSRAPSLGSSASSSFVYKPPTSPLVHSASNTDLDLSTASDAGKASRRRTLPPEAFSVPNASPRGSRAASYSRPLPNLRRENTTPYQAHQPRRSIASNSYQGGSSPFTPSNRSRAPSLSSEFSPLQHASMVGSYEESILRGRMSTTPSKPLDFLAQIGVLGKGDCKPSLRCPAHVMVPFPAVFYSYSVGAGRRNTADDSPSPYVGNIDLEHNLKPAPMRQKKRQETVKQVQEEHDRSLRDITAPENTSIGLQLERRIRDKRRRRSRSPQAPLGGCYRIPQQGQMQIIIKNPNKTAVKLFLVPYDLEGMEPGTKTFIRQRSYSKGPILDIPGTNTAAGFEKPTLRYLVHLRICCPSKGRFYLYDNIRVVFANRVPDGKEKLRNEIQLPEPRYSTWKANRDVPSSITGAKLAAENASRRRSSGFGAMSFGFGDIDGISKFESLSFSRRTPATPPLPMVSQTCHHSQTTTVVSPSLSLANADTRSMSSIPLLPVETTRPSSKDSTSTVTSALSSLSPHTQMQVVSGFSIQRSPSPAPSSRNGNYNHDIDSESGTETSSPASGGPYTKLRRQEGRYGSSERFHGVGNVHGLLAQKLKGLGVGFGQDSDSSSVLDDKTSGNEHNLQESKAETVDKNGDQEMSGS